MKGKISIEEALARMKQGGAPFSLDYIRSKGKKQGTKKRIIRALHGHVYKAQVDKTDVEHVSALEDKDTSDRYRKRGLIPIVDLDRHQQNTLFISHIIGFNGQRVIH